MSSPGQRVFAFLISWGQNKANLWDLIAAASLIILIKLESNSQFFFPCDLEIWWMTSKSHRAPPLYYLKRCVSFQIHRWIETGVTVRKRWMKVKIGAFLSCVNMKFDAWPWKTIGHLLYITSSFTSASFQSHGWIQTGVTVRILRKRSIRVKFVDFLSCLLCDLKI